VVKTERKKKRKESLRRNTWVCLLFHYY